MEKQHIKIKKAIVFVAELCWYSQHLINVDFFAEFISQVPLEAITYIVDTFCLRWLSLNSEKNMKKKVTFIELFI